MGLNDQNRNKLQAIIDEHFDNMHNEINEEMKGSIQDQNWYMLNQIEAAELTLSNEIYESIAWQPTMADGTPYPLAWVRPDIIRKGLAVPVGVLYYGAGQPLPYRWYNEETFEVCYMGAWQTAQSIDWDFSDAVPQEMSASYTP
jgi:hypothetical protein